MYSFQTLLSKIQGSSIIDFGDLFNESVTLFKKVWIQGLILQLLSILIMLPFIIVFYVPYFKLVLETSSNGVLDSTAFTQGLIADYGMSLIWVYLLMLIVSMFSYVLYLGFYRIVKQIDHGQAFVFSDLFHFFKAASIGKALGLAVTYLFISVVATLLCFLPLIYVMVPLMFLLPIFAYNPDLSISEIVKASFALGNKKWGITFLTLILNGILIYVITLVTFGLGVLFVSCFIYLPQYIIYKKVIGFEGLKSDVQSIDI
tara:strand:- start:9061 stop:9837 length:777 start_codon:yes stop_codon:yes gene_type:complete